MNRSSMTNKERALEFLQRLRDLKIRVSPVSGMGAAEYGLFLVDLSGWRLRFSEHTPMIWVRAESAKQLTGRDLDGRLRELVKLRGWARYECIIVLEGDGRELRAQIAQRYSDRFIIVDTDDQRKILDASAFESEKAFLHLVCKQVPLSNLAPYEMSAPVEGSRFFGREREISRVLGKLETTFAITGIRRIGKTSLLKEIKRRMIDQGEDPQRIVWMDCSNISSLRSFAQEIVMQLHFRELDLLKGRRQQLFTLSDFLKRMSKMYGGQITIFLDEVDKLLSGPREVRDILSTLRASVHTGDCRCIAAGFQTLMNALSDSKSPFYRGFEPLPLGTFSERETENLVLGPMKSLGVQFENEQSIVTRIQDDTRGHPHLVQYYCSELINQLERNETLTVKLSDLSAIYVSNGLKEETYNDFRDNLLSQDKLLVYVLLLSFPDTKETFTQEEMFGSLRRQGIGLSNEEIDRTCDRLVLAGVFIRDGNKYGFALPILSAILRKNYNLVHLLSVAKKGMGL